MSTEYSKTLEFIVMILEGGGKYHDVPGDPGGPTNYGISLRFLKSIEPSATSQTIRKMTFERAADLYEKHFFQPSGANRLAFPLAGIVLDQAINQGVGAARRDLRRIFNLGDTTNKFTETELQYIIGQNPKVYATRLLHRRLERYKAIRTWPKFGRGWTNRLTLLARFLNVPFNPNGEDPMKKAPVKAAPKVAAKPAKVAKAPAKAAAGKGMKKGKDAC